MRPRALPDLVDRAVPDPVAQVDPVVLAAPEDKVGREGKAVLAGRADLDADLVDQAEPVDRADRGAAVTAVATCTPCWIGFPKFPSQNSRLVMHLSFRAPQGRIAQI